MASVGQAPGPVVGSETLVARPPVPKTPPDDRPRKARAAAWVIVAGVLVVLVVRGGGSFDLVARQEVCLGLWLVLAIGFAAGVLPRADPRLGLVPVGALLLLGLWTALSLDWTQSDERTVTEVARVVGFAGVMLMVLTCLDRATWRYAAGALVAVALGVCAVAVGTRILPDRVVGNAISESFGTSRLSFPFHYWNAVGTWSSMAIALGLAWSAHARSAVTRMLCLAGLPVAALCGYLTYSRAVVGGVALAVLCVWALARARLLVLTHALVAALCSAAVILIARGQPAIAQGTGTAGGSAVVLAVLGAAALCAALAAVTHFAGAAEWRLSRRASTVIAVPAAILCAVLVPVFAVRELPAAWDSFRGPGATAVSQDPAQRLTTLSSARYELFSVQLDSFEQRPGSGTGAGTFEFTWNRNGRTSEFVRDGHSLFLETMSELGWPGLLLLVAFLASCLAVALLARRRSRRIERTGALAGLIAAFAVFVLHASVDWMWESTAVAALALGGIAIAAVPLGGLARARAAWRPPVRALAAVASLAAALLMVPMLASTGLVRDSQASFRAGDLTRAADRAQKAVDAAPWSASAYAQRALVDEASGRLDEARDDLGEAMRREPENWRFPLLLARVQAERGKPRDAVAAYRRARALRPRALVFTPIAPPVGGR